MKRQIIQVVTLGAGLMDTGTGLGLIIVPGFVLSLIGIPAGADDPSMRIVGAFVFAVGMLYLIGWYLTRRRVEATPLIYVWGVTAWIRFCVGTTVGTFVILGSLEHGWLLVAGTDLALALFQGAWMSGGRLSHDDN